MQYSWISKNKITQCQKNSELSYRSHQVGERKQILNYLSTACFRPDSFQRRKVYWAPATWETLLNHWSSRKRINSPTSCIMELKVTSSISSSKVYAVSASVTLSSKTGCFIEDNSRSYSNGKNLSMRQRFKRQSRNRMKITNEICRNSKSETDMSRRKPKEAWLSIWGSHLSKSALISKLVNKAFLVLPRVIPRPLNLKSNNNNY